MKNWFLVILIVISVHSYTFQDYTLEFNRNYTPEEREARKTTFEKNMEIIQETNSKGLSYKLGPTKWTDRFENETQKATPDDLRVQSSDKLQQSKNKSLRVSNTEDTQYVDWRQKNIISSIKDQGQCGSCWAFAATSSIQSLFLLKSNISYDLSEQYLLQCSHQQNSCIQGSFLSVFNYIKQQGSFKATQMECHSIHQWSGKPHTQGLCQTTDLKRLVSNTSFQHFFYLTKSMIKTILRQQPIVAQMVSTNEFSQYKTGIFKCKEEDMKVRKINHGVQIVGFNAAENYYIIKNSWDTTWGINGFGYVDMDMDCMISRSLYIVGRTTQNQQKDGQYNEGCKNNIQTPSNNQILHTPDFQILLQMCFYIVALCLFFVLQ